MKNGTLATLQQAIKRIGGGRAARYPAKLRGEIVDLIKERRANGETWTEIGADLGLPYETMNRWSKKVIGASAAMKRVEVVVAPTSRSLTLISPNGIRVEGASVEEIVALVRALG